MDAMSGWGMLRFTSSRISGLFCIKSVSKATICSCDNAFNLVIGSTPSADPPSVDGVILYLLLTGLRRMFLLPNKPSMDPESFSGDGDGVEAEWGDEFGGESVRVRRFLGLVLVGKSSLVTEFGGVCQPALPL